MRPAMTSVSHIDGMSLLDSIVTHADTDAPKSPVNVSPGVLGVKLDMQLNASPQSWVSSTWKTCAIDVTVTLLSLTLLPPPPPPPLVQAARDHSDANTSPVERWCMVDHFASDRPRLNRRLATKRRRVGHVVVLLTLRCQGGRQARRRLRSVGALARRPGAAVGGRAPADPSVFGRGARQRRRDRHRTRGRRRPRAATARWAAALG